MSSKPRGAGGIGGPDGSGRSPGPDRATGPDGGTGSGAGTGSAAATGSTPSGSGDASSSDRPAYRSRRARRRALRKARPTAGKYRRDRASPSATSVNGSGVGVMSAASTNMRNTVTRHQPSSRRALATPVTLSMSTTSGNWKAKPAVIIIVTTNET